MSSIFPGRRKQPKPIVLHNELDDPWNMRDEPFLDGAAASTSNTRNPAVRIMHSVRRFSYSTPRKRERGHPEGGMYSTPAESNLPTPSCYSFHGRPDTRPTIEQIAMGLHISRTPHILPPRSPRSPHSHYSRRSLDSSLHVNSQHQSVSGTPARHTSMLAPIRSSQPTRSSLKKSARPQTADSSTLAPSASDASLSTLTSNGPATPMSVRSAPATSFPGRLRLEMLRLLPTRKGSFGNSSRSDSPGVMTPSDTDSLSGGLTPRKSVRFSPGVRDELTEEVE